MSLCSSIEPNDGLDRQLDKQFIRVLSSPLLATSITLGGSLEDVRRLQ